MYSQDARPVGAGRNAPIAASTVQSAQSAGDSLKALSLGPVGRRRFTLPEIAWHIHRACRRNILRYGRPGVSLRPKYLSFIACADALDWLDIELIYARYQAGPGAEQGRQIAWSLRVVIADEWRTRAQRQPSHVPRELATAAPLAAYDGALLSYCSDCEALADVAVTTENYFADGGWLDLLWAMLQTGQPSESVVALETGALDEADLLAHMQRPPDDTPFAVTPKYPHAAVNGMSLPGTTSEHHPDGAEPMNDNAWAFAQDSWLRRTGRTENLPDASKR
ncbi:MAG: hypothetical protein ABI068_13275 [Ktedonobacterales bacterium]